MIRIINYSTVITQNFGKNHFFYLLWVYQKPGDPSDTGLAECLHFFLGQNDSLLIIFKKGTFRRDRMDPDGPETLVLRPIRPGNSRLKDHRF